MKALVMPKTFNTISSRNLNVGSTMSGSKIYEIPNVEYERSSNNKPQPTTFNSRSNLNFQTDSNAIYLNSREFILSEDGKSDISTDLKQTKVNKDY